MMETSRFTDGFVKSQNTVKKVEVIAVNATKTLS